MNDRNSTVNTSELATAKLRKPQIRILKALADGRARTRQQIVKDASVERAWCTTWIGSNDPEKRSSNDAKYFPSLITLGLVRIEKMDVAGQDVLVYEATTKGKRIAADITD